MFPRAATWRRLPRPYGNYKPRVALIVGLTMDTMVTSRNLQIFSNTRIEEGQNLVLRNVFADLKRWTGSQPRRPLLWQVAPRRGAARMTWTLTQVSTMREVASARVKRFLPKEEACSLFQ